MRINFSEDQVFITGEGWHVVVNRSLLLRFKRPINLLITYLIQIFQDGEEDEH